MATAPTTAVAEPTAGQPDVPRRSRITSGAAGMLAGWAMALVSVVLTVLVLGYYGVSARDMAMFAVYSVGCVTLPGTLLWRWLRGGGVVAIDVAAGTVVGFAVELPVYALARLLGAPLAVLAWPVLTIVAFAALPGLRRHWRGSGERLPVGAAAAATLGYLYFLTFAASGFRTTPLIGAAADHTNADIPFHIALIGEFKHHLPVTTPWVDGTPLRYHVYVYLHGAAASWLTGIEPQELVLRLLALPMLAALPLLIIAVARALTRRWWPGALAVAVGLIGIEASPYLNMTNPAFSGTIMDDIWTSPTQTFGMVIFGGVVLVMTDLLPGRRPIDPPGAPAPDEPSPSAPGRVDDNAAAIPAQGGPPPDEAAPAAGTGSVSAPAEGPAAVGGRGATVRRWILFALLVGAVAGAKSTFLPMLAAGLALALLVSLITRRRPGPILPVFGVVLAWLAYAQIFLYGGGASGLVLDPLITVKYSPLGLALLGPAKPLPHQYLVLAELAILGLIGTVLAATGALGLLRKGWRTDPAVLALVGYTLAGYGALYVFGHPGLSQVFFARSASPYMGLLAATGIAALVAARSSQPRRPGREALLGLVAVALGTVALLWERETVGAVRLARTAHPVMTAAKPYLVLLAGLLLIAVVVVLVGRALRLRRTVVLACVIAALLSTAVVTGTRGTVALAQLVSSGAPLRDRITYPQGIPTGGIEAARWLRDHSSTDDLVATDSHCYVGTGTGMACDNRSFWLAAYAERRVLVEGWAYTSRSYPGLWKAELTHSVYWNQPLLAQNDAVFANPTAESVRAFVAQNGVRWLVAVAPQASPTLANFATLRYHSGDVSIYEVTG